MMHLTARNHDLDLFVSGKCDRLLFPGIFQGLLGVFRRPRIGGTSLAGGRGTILGALIGLSNTENAYIIKEGPHEN